jgi:hypothetical protein
MLSPRSFCQAEQRRNVWTVVPGDGVTLEDMLKPEYWAHVAAQLTTGDKIEVRPVAGEWYAELYVRSVGAVAARVVVLGKWDLSTPATAASRTATGSLPGFTVKHRGITGGWSVIRDSDKAVMFEKGASREDADDWLKRNEG